MQSVIVVYSDSLAEASIELQQLTKKFYIKQIIQVTDTEYNMYRYYFIVLAESLPVTN